MLVFKARRKNPTAGPQLTASQRRIMKIMADAMEEVRRQVIRDEPKILDVLLHGPDSRIPSLVSNDPWWKAQRLIADELFAELVAAGRRTGSGFPKIQKATLSYRFDAERPEAAAWAEKEAGNLIVEVTQGQVDMVRDYVSRSQMGEFTVPQVARNLRDVVGLTSQQSGWVDNYRSRFISDRLAAGDTLEQAMRAAAGPTERYQKRIHKYRTETIARTEILRAANEGRNQAWQQGIEEGYVSPAAQKQWATEPDACEICIPLDGESVPITGEFPDGDPPLHPNCRCDVLMVDVDVSDYENMTWDEIDAELDQLLTDNIPTESEPSTSILDNIPSTPTANHSVDYWLDDDFREARTLVDEWKEPMLSGSIDPETFKLTYKVPEDMMLKGILQEQGFDALPTVVSPTEFAQLQDAGLQYLGRGITGETKDEVAGYIDNFIQGPDFNPRGMFGSGTYASPNEDVLEFFSTHTASGVEVSNGDVINMLIKPDAKVVDYSEVKALESKLTNDRNKYRRDGDPLWLFQDEGRTAAANGIDIVRIPNPNIGGNQVDADYYLILNRGSLIVEGTV